jgi:hypothetical protein
MTAAQALDQLPLRPRDTLLFTGAVKGGCTSLNRRAARMASAVRATVLMSGGSIDSAP